MLHFVRSMWVFLLRGFCAAGFWLGYYLMLYWFMNTEIMKHKEDAEKLSFLVIIHSWRNQEFLQIHYI